MPAFRHIVARPLVFGLPWLLAAALALVLHLDNGSRARAHVLLATTVDPAHFVRAGHRPIDLTHDFATYNCAGLAFRNYRRMSLEELHQAVAAFQPLPASDSPAPPGWIRLWVWEYDVHHETEDGLVEPSRPDGHVVAGESDPKTGAAPALVYCKYNGAPVLPPAPPEQWTPPARELVGTNQFGRRVFVVRDHMTEHFFAAPPAALPH